MYVFMSAWIAFISRQLSDSFSVAQILNYFFPVDEDGKISAF